MLGTPDPRERRILSDLTTPDASERRILSDLTTPSPVQAPQVLGAGGERRRALGVQRFSLRSRRSAPYSPRCVLQPGAKTLLSLEPSIAHAVHATHAHPPASGSSAVRLELCNCSWKQPLSLGEPRLCQKNTEDHVEYWLLESLGSRYASERQAERQRAGGGLFPPEPGVNLASLAAQQKVDVYFILQPEKETVVGYVALQKSPRDTSATTHQLFQVYVDPRFRRQAFATNALRVLLAGTSEVCVLSPCPVLPGLLAKLGFDCHSDPSAGGAAPDANAIFCRSCPLDQNHD